MVVLELVLEHAPTPVPMLAPVVLELVQVVVLAVADALDVLGTVKMTV